MKVKKKKGKDARPRTFNLYKRVTRAYRCLRESARIASCYCSVGRTASLCSAALYSAEFILHLQLQHYFDLRDPHLADLGFNGPNSEAGLFRKYRTSPAESRKV
jgi:hypothetical protein